MATGKMQVRFLQKNRIATFMGVVMSVSLSKSADFGKNSAFSGFFGLRLRMSVGLGHLSKLTKN
ncbi:hypothetical protein [Acinetobacter baumannii]|uniref:hypothetical protein n=1 Tax=Acinetobacter baumannii TaxID=470 RepID=UPI00117886B1|nr:hypothetical protein [Acinetobacter baumannii]